MTRILAGLAVLALGIPLAACEVEWGGAQMALEDPAPVEEVEEVPEEEVIVPLPPGPLLFRVRVADDGTATAVPIARMSDSLPVDMELPEEFDSDFRSRFDSAFLAPGTELALVADGRRIGSILLGDQRTTWGGTCPSAVNATTLLASGQQLPVSGFALPLDMVAASPGASNPVEPDRRMRTYGPVLTENILEQRGYDRAYLAQRAVLETVSYASDAGPALVATYLVNDSLSTSWTEGRSVSLFFMARFDPSRGYYPVWHEYRRYRSAADREVFTYEDWIHMPSGRLDFIERYGDGDIRLAASLEREDAGKREIDWLESERCQSRFAFDGAAGATPGTPQVGQSTGAPAAATPNQQAAEQQAGQPGRTDTAGNPGSPDTAGNPRRQTEPDIQPRPPVQLPDTAAGQ